MHRALVFDLAASSYDAQRSGYPAELFADLTRIAKLRPGDRVLEIGCGSGQATADLIASGLDVTGVDPGATLLDLARIKFRNVNSVRFEISTFEAWPRGARTFRLIAAAQSWHWVRPEIGFDKAAAALDEDGRLAIFGHTPAWSPALIEALEPVYAELAPELKGPPPEIWYLADGPIPDLIVASGRFLRPDQRSYRWRRAFTADGFAAYLGTRSDHLLLPGQRRAELLTRVKRALPETVEADWITNLYVAARA